MYEECIEGLAVRKDGIYMDMTVGGFGHGRGICEKLSPSGMYIGFDLDGEALKRVEAGREGLECGIRLFHDNFHNFGQHLDEAGIDTIDGCLADLGVSSFQIDEADRGFSFMKDGPLDMRMDQTSGMSAADIVNEYSADELSRIFREYGEEKFARNIAVNIVKARAEKPIGTTSELVEIVKRSIPAKFRENSHKNCATRVFQSLRIETNGELEGLYETLASVVDRLRPGGRLCVISFHSLEDRIVKQVFADKAKGCTCPKDFPICVCGNKPKIKILTRSALQASEKEVEDNPRSRSAKLRICEKLETE